MWVRLALYFTVCCLVVGKSQEAANVVHTTCGDVRGIIRSTTTGSVLALLGIPFAEPPVGERRFKKPMPKKPWKGVLNATSLPPMCPQPPVKVNRHFDVKATDPFSEDCLFLNVFKPVSKHDSTLKHVVVFVHGGAFTFGGIYLKIFDASELAVRGDLVVVTIAYRLGPFGFLYLGTEEAPGNMGLYDQQLAMQWVRENVRSFGGNPDVITAIGQSAGAMSLGIHLLSPGSVGLFRRAYMQSGSPFVSAFSSSPVEARRKTDMLASYLDCKERNHRELSVSQVISCLQAKHVDDIVKGARVFNADGLNGFFPVLGGDFVLGMTDNAPALVPHSVSDVLISICAAEGDFLIDHMLKLANNIDNIQLVSKRYMALLIKLSLARSMIADAEPIFERYFRPAAADSGVQVVHAGSDILKDFYFGCPARSIAQWLSASNTSVYFLLYDEQLSNLDWPDWVRATHGDDLAFSLGSALVLDGHPSEGNVRATENLINVVATFSRCGVPKVLDGTVWPKFDDEGQYLHIRNGSSVRRKHFLQSTCEFWRSIVPNE